MSRTGVLRQGRIKAPDPVRRVERHTHGGCGSMSSTDSIRPATSRVKRQSTGKRLRFEVFKRDYFTCRYCGAQPPDVVLVLDHVLAVANGGVTTLDNLVTSCEPCNQGKAAKALGDASPRVDADLQTLEAQQEIAEMRRYQLVLREREQALQELIFSLQEHWCNTTGLDWYPTDALIRQLLNKYSPDVVGEGLQDVGGKLASGYLKEWKWSRYLWAVCRNLAQEQA